MENASFIGIFGLAEPDIIPSGPDCSGVCYAWQTAGGKRVVLPLNQQHIPSGACLIMDAQEFGRHMLPIDPGGTPGLCPSSSILRPDSPDLLGIWYEQALNCSTDDSDETESLEAILNAQGLTDTPTHAPVSRDEAVFTPVWHPDDLLDKSAGQDTVLAPAPCDNSDAFARFAALARQNDSALPARPPAPPRQYPGAAGQAGHILPGDNGSGKAASPEDRRTFPRTPLQPPMQTFRQPPLPEQEESEARSAKLEQVMRAKFDALMERLDAAPDPALDEEISRLLALGAGFSWKQKFMFTEFGLALRRKRKPALALSSHMRALALAPQDEHVLFNVARTEYELGRIDEAEHYLDKALSVAPDFAVARNFKAFLAGRT